MSLIYKKYKIIKKIFFEKTKAELKICISAEFYFLYLSYFPPHLSCVLCVRPYFFYILFFFFVRCYFFVFSVLCHQLRGARRDIAVRWSIKEICSVFSSPLVTGMAGKTGQSSHECNKSLRIISVRSPYWYRCTGYYCTQRPLLSARLP